MIEPTESFTKSELDRFADAVIAIKELILTNPKVLISAPHFTPIDKVDEVSANRNLLLRESIQHLPALPFNRIKNSTLMSLSIEEIKNKVVTASEAAQSSLV
jgi:glycine dehydrogenase